MLPGVPQVFKDVLFWPDKKKETTRKRKSLESIVPVITSDQWIALAREREEEKRKLEEEKAQKKKKEGRKS